MKFSYIVNWKDPQIVLEQLYLSFSFFSFLFQQQVYPPTKFCRYNMFNHYFFNDDKSEQIFSNFITETDDKHVAMVTDPPFGGLVEVLVSTFNRIIETWKQKSSMK